MNLGASAGTVASTSMDFLRRGVQIAALVSHEGVPANPPAPDAEAAESERMQRRLAEEEAERAYEEWCLSLPQVDCVAYPTLEALADDIRMLNHDPMAMARLLRSVAGEGLGPQCMRLVSRLRAADGVAMQALAAGYGPDVPYAGAMLGLPDYAADVRFECTTGGHAVAMVLDIDRDCVCALPIVQSRDGFAIDGKILCKAHQEYEHEAVSVVRQVPAGLFVTRGAFDDWVRLTIELACSGEAVSYEDAITVAAREFVWMHREPARASVAGH